MEVDEDEHEEACPGAAVRRLLRFGADEREGILWEKSKSVSPAISEALQPARFLPRREWVAGIAIESETRKRQRTHSSAKLLLAKSDPSQDGRMRFMVQGKETRYFVIIAKWEESKVPRMKFASA